MILDLAAQQGSIASKKKRQGVIWGKDTKNFEGKAGMLRKIASNVSLMATATSPVFKHDNVHWLGHQSKDGWLNLLLESKFLIGLGNPLLGPSAIDAISVRCMFLNPVYSQPMRGGAYPNQHPYALRVAPEYVCTYHENSVEELQRCVNRALEADLKPFIPPDLTWEQHLLRVQRIFKL